MNYEQAWEELEISIKSGLMIYDSVFLEENPNSIERATIATLEAVEDIMKGIKKKYSEGGKK